MCTLGASRGEMSSSSISKLVPLHGVSVGTCAFLENKKIDIFCLTTTTTTKAKKKICRHHHASRMLFNASNTHHSLLRRELTQVFHLLPLIRR